MNHRKLLIVGAFGTGNLGDDAILEGLLKMFAGDKSYRNNYVVVFSINPEETRLVFKVNARRRNLTDLLLSDEILIGGGELIQDRKNMGAKYSFLGLLAKILGKRVMFYAIGVSSTKSLIGRLLTRVSLNLADEISVRDLSSKRRLKLLGVHREIKIAQDPALELEPISAESASRLLQAEGIVTRKSTRPFLLGLASQCLYDKKTNEKTHLFLLSIARRVLVRYKDTSIVYVPFWPSRDLPCGEWLDKQLNTESFKVFRRSVTPSEMLGLVRQLDLLISTRLHPLILASRAGVPSIGVSIFEKIEAFCFEHGVPYVEVGDIDRLSELVTEVVDSKLKKQTIG